VLAFVEGKRGVRLLQYNALYWSMSAKGWIKYSTI